MKSSVDLCDFREDMQVQIIETSGDLIGGPTFFYRKCLWTRQTGGKAGSPVTVQC